MFLRENEKWGSWDVIRLFDQAGGIGFSVAPQRGGCLLDLYLGKKNVLDGYTNAAGLESLPWAKSAILAPFPNRLKDGRYSAGGREFQFPLNEPERQNALHGFVLDKVFEVERVGLSEETASIALAYRYAGDFSFYPFPFVLRVLYSLRRSGHFEMILELENTGGEEMPAGLGWHPYFGLGAPADWMELQLPAVEKVIVDGRMIPTGKKVVFSDFREMKSLSGAAFDTGFRLLEKRAVSEAVLGLGSFRLHYWQDSGFPFLQVFIPPAKQSIALEPMTCNIDAFNNGEGLRMLRPGEIMRGKAGVWFQYVPGPV